MNKWIQDYANKLGIWGDLRDYYNRSFDFSADVTIEYDTQENLFIICAQKRNNPYGYNRKDGELSRATDELAKMNNIYTDSQLKSISTDPIARSYFQQLRDGEITTLQYAFTFRAEWGCHQFWENMFMNPEMASMDARKAALAKIHPRAMWTTMWSMELKSFDENGIHHNPSAPSRVRFDRSTPSLIEYFQHGRRNLDFIAAMPSSFQLRCYVYPKQIRDLLSTNKTAQRKALDAIMKQYPDDGSRPEHMRSVNSIVYMHNEKMIPMEILTEFEFPLEDHDYFTLMMCI